MNSLRALKLTLIALLALALLPAAAAAAPKFDREIPVPGVETNDKIVEGQDGNVWVAVSGANAGDNDVARITPAGEVKEFALSAGATALSGASGIGRDAEGHLWVTGEAAVARFTPNQGEVGATAIEPLAQVKGAGQGGASIVLGPDGRMWIATLETVLAFKSTETDLETNRQLIAVAGLQPHDIDVAGQRIAIADQGSRIVTFTVDAAGTATQQDFPVKGFSQGVAGLGSGTVAYSLPGPEATVPATPQHVGLISPPDVLPIVPTPEGKGDPFGAAVGSDGAVWFVLSAANELARLAPGANQLTLVTGMQTGSLARQIAAGPGDTLWVTVTKADSEGVARFSGLEPPRVVPPNPPSPPREPQTRLLRPIPGTVLTRGRRARVTFRFSSPDPGAAFECVLVRPGARDFVFRPCRSPKSYRLKPGRYAFRVSAVVGGVVDETAAGRGFRVVRVFPSERR